MGKLSYSMGVSLDGFIAGRDGNIYWSAPDEELHRFHNEQMRDGAAQLYGRRMYEAMRYWETAEEEHPSSPDYELEFARLWNQTPRLVVSNTLERVEGGARLVRGDLASEVATLKDELDGDIHVGGAGLAASLIALGLIDEFGLFVYPVVLGAGTPFFPATDEPIDLRHVETRTFAMGVVYVRYEVA